MEFYLIKSCLLDMCVCVNSRMDPILYVIVMVSLFAGGGGGGGGLCKKKVVPLLKKTEKRKKKKQKGNVFSSAHMHLFVGSLVRGFWCVRVCVIDIIQPTKCYFCKVRKTFPNGARNPVWCWPVRDKE